MHRTKLQLDSKWLLVLGVAALWRAVYLLDFSSLPFWDGPLFDSVVYLRQAERVLEGRHGDPSLLAMSPLYGYFLALFGPNPVVVSVAQAMLGLLTIGLAASIGEALEPKYGFVAAIAVSTYGMFSFYESKLMTEALGLALLASSLAALYRAADRDAVSWAALSGVLLSLATLARASLVPSLPLLAISAFVLPSTNKARFGSAFCAGLAVVLLAHGAFTYSVAGRFIPVILTSKTFATMSENSWDGRLRASDGGSRPPSAWDVVDQAARSLEQDEAGPAPSIDWLGVLADAPPKLWRTFSNTERGFDYPFYGERDLLPSFAFLPGSFVGLLVVAIAGLARARDRLSRVAPLLALALGTVATIVLTHPSSRYRLPLALAFALLSPLGVAASVAEFRRGKQALVLGISALVLIASLDLILHRRENPAALERVLSRSYRAAGNGAEAEAHALRAEALERPSAR